MLRLKLVLIHIFTAFILFFETVSAGFWRVFSVFLFFTGLCLFGVSSIWVLIPFIAGLIYVATKDIPAFKMPRVRDIRRRIELESGVKHRPLSGLRDTQVRLGNKNQGRFLWRMNQNWLQQFLPAMRFPRPVSAAAASDPYGVRFFAVIFALAGFVVAGSAGHERLVNGFLPFEAFGFTPQTTLQAIIIPPDYTGLDQFSLEADQRVDIPQGSVLKIIVQGGIGTPSLSVNDRSFDFQKGENASFIYEGTLFSEDQGDISIKRFFMPLATWKYRLIPDEPPALAMNGEIEILASGMIRVPLEVYDDYGVSGIVMRMDLSETVIDVPLGKPYIDTRSVASPAGQSYTFAPVFDLTWHTWAGLPVTFSIHAKDGHGQISSLRNLELVLPERIFTHDTAKFLIEKRIFLSWNPLSPTRKISRDIENLLSNPAQFNNNLVSFLAIRMAASRLYWSPPSEDGAQDLINLLWDIAVGIEDGHLSLALRNLRDVQNALEEAIRNPDTSKEHMSEIMSALRQAMAAYFSELSQEMRKRIKNGEEIPMIAPDMLSQVINPDVLQSFLDQLEQEMRNGNMDKMQEMLSQLQEMMDHLSSGIAQLPPDMQMMEDGVNELQQLIERQESLLEQTREQIKMSQTLQNFGKALPLNEELFRKWGLREEDFPPPPVAGAAPDIDTSDNKVEQESLRFILGQVMLDASEILDEIPENLGLAEQAMRGSSGTLGANDPHGSVPFQEEALRQMKQAQEQLTQQFMAGMQRLGGMALMPGGAGMKYDPLGRPYGGEDNPGGLFPGSRVKIPDEAERKRAVDILRELRKRSGERERPMLELDYFRRLLKQF